MGMHPAKERCCGVKNERNVLLLELQIIMGGGAHIVRPCGETHIVCVRQKNGVELVARYSVPTSVVILKLYF